MVKRKLALRKDKDYAAELLKLNPPHVTDQPIIAEMERVGIEPGKSFDISKVDPTVRKALEAAPAKAPFNLTTWFYSPEAEALTGG